MMTHARHWTVIVATVILGASCGVSAAPHHESRPSRSPAAFPAPTPSAQAPPSDAPGLPNPRTVNRRDPSAVARAAVTTMAMVDTVSDDPNAFQRDAGLRALTFMTPSYAGHVRASAFAPAPTAVWDTWKSHRVFLAVRLGAAGIDQQPRDTAAVAHRAWELTTIPTGRDGWRGVATTTTTVFVTVVRSGRGEWLVSACSLQ